MTELLFVYGTLRRSAGGSLHPLLRTGCRYVGAATCGGRLFDLGSYPGVVASDRASGRVVGELYRLSSTQAVLDRLDRYEGREYERRTVRVEREDGSAVDAWIYLYRGSLDSASMISSGDYLNREA